MYGCHKGLNAFQRLEIQQLYNNCKSDQSLCITAISRYRFQYPGLIGSIGLIWTV